MCIFIPTKALIFMKKLLFGKPGPAAVHFALLLMRVVWGVTMIPAHGWPKLAGFDQKKATFMDFMGLGSTLSLGLAVFAEFFCSLLLIAGLFTRLATLPLIITMLVIMQQHEWALIGKYESVIFFFTGYVLILILGPGKYSLDQKFIYKSR